MTRSKSHGIVLTLVAAVVIVACGGGGGSSGSSLFGSGSGSSGDGDNDSGSTNTSALNVSAALVDASGTATASIALAGSRVKVTAMNNGVAQAGSLVTVKATSGESKLVLSPSDGTALTDSAGVAYVQIAPASLSESGAFQLSATAVINGLTASTTLSGSITGGSVSLGAIDTGVSGQLPAFGTTELVVPVSGASASTGVRVSFSSSCVNAGKASLSPVTATMGADGKAKTTYKDLGCATSANATDSISASVDGASSVAQSATIALSQPQATNIEFMSATPSVIYLPGSGGATSSKVAFKVVNQSGVGIPGIRVNLTPDTNAGGLTLNSQSTFPVAVTSDANGLVEVTVLSGTQPTPVRITATYEDVGNAVSLRSVSSALSINSGLPAQKNMSTSLSSFNIDGMNYDGEPVDLTVRLADRSGNPVPDGTTVNFRTESGQVVGSCQTLRDANGLSKCSGRLESQEPRPSNGYVSAVAYALGEESFVDANGNNVFNTGESFDDLGDVFVDTDESLSWLSGEDFVPFGTGAVGACPSGSGSVFSKANTCDGVWGKAHVRNTVRFVLSTTNAGFRWNEYGSTLLPTTPSSFGTVPIVCDGITYMTYVLRDTNQLRNNPYPAGSTVTAEGTNVSVKVLDSTVASTLSPTLHQLEFSSRACDSGVRKGSASVKLTVRTPRGVAYTIGIPVQ